MTREEFLNIAPHTLEHEIWGTVYLKVVMDEPDFKACSYLNQEGSSTYNTYGQDWEKVFEQLMSRLRKHGLN